MIKSKRDQLIKLSITAKANNSTKELGERLSLFLKNEYSVFDDNLTFPIWCVKTNNIKMLDVLFWAGVDFSHYYIDKNLVAKKIKNYTMSTIITVAKSELTTENYIHFKKQINRQRSAILNLHEACRKGDYQTVLELINSGVPVDGRNKELTTPLMIACQYGRLNIVELLISMGADVNATDFMGATPLMWASYGNNVEILKFLVKHGAVVNAKDRVNGSTPLIWWATNSRDNVNGVKFLVENGAIASQIVKYKYNEVKNNINCSKYAGIDWTAKDHAKTAGNLEISNYLTRVRN